MDTATHQDATNPASPRIRVLNATVIDHIAAGEVVERPASVVKELVENAFDAGASTVQVDLDRGGLDGITVTDDGMGMAPADARLCILRHATSKLRESADLFCIRTLGFRGEALSSIASVAHVTITTRPPDARTGFRLEIRGGEIISEKEVGCPRGTSIAVRDIFYNTPARRKFLRASATEQAHVVDTALRVGLARRRGGLLVVSGARRLVDIPDDATGLARVIAALGPRVRDLSALSASQDGVRIDGFVSKPGLDRSGNRGQWLFVNGRFVRDRMLQRALAESHAQAAPGRHPTAIVHIDLDPEAVDVNVHPQKLEVRFADATTVFRVLSTALHNVAPIAHQAAQDGTPLDQAMLQRFANRAWSLPQSSDTERVRSKALPMESPARGLSDNAARGSSDTAVQAPSDSTEPQRVATPHSEFHERPNEAPPRHTPLQSAVASVATGYFQRLAPWGNIAPYWIVGDRRGALLLDAVAASQWLARTSLRLQFNQGHIDVRNLLFPARLELPRALMARLSTRYESLQPLGFEVEPSGPDTFMLRAVPASLLHAEPHALMQACVAALWPNDGAGDPTPQQALSALEACVEQVQGPTGRAEFEALLRELDKNGVRPSHDDVLAWLRRIDAADVQRLFGALS